MTERAVGTNAIGTALVEQSPVQLFSAERFENAQVPWYCTAEPVHDPIDGSLIGIVDVSGPALSLHPLIRALVSVSVQLAEARLQRMHGERHERLRRAVEPVLAGANDPLLVVDDHGWVVTQPGLAMRDRIEAPRADRAVALPGLGPCLPERLQGGWLIRPAERDAQVIAVLDVSGPQAVLEVTAGSSSWPSALSPRHNRHARGAVADRPAGHDGRAAQHPALRRLRASGLGARGVLAPASHGRGARGERAVPGGGTA